MGSLAPATNGTLIGLLGALTVAGDKSDTLNVDDTGSAATNVVILTNSSLTGLGMAGIASSEHWGAEYFTGQRQQHPYDCFNQLEHRDISPRWQRSKHHQHSEHQQRDHGHHAGECVRCH